MRQITCLRVWHACVTLCYMHVWRSIWQDDRIWTTWHLILNLNMLSFWERCFENPWIMHMNTNKIEKTTTCRSQGHVSLWARWSRDHVSLGTCAISLTIFVIVISWWIFLLHNKPENIPEYTLFWLSLKGEMSLMKSICLLSHPGPTGLESFFTS